MDVTLILVAGNIILNGLVIGLWKPWLGAYGGEKGKNLARKEDLNEILAEVRSVRIAQKEIESKLAGDLWHRQTLWQEKRTTFADVLAAIHKSTYACNELWQIRKLIVSGEVAADTRDIDNLLRHHFTEFHEAETELIRLTALIQLFANQASAEILKEYLKKRRALDFVNAPDDIRTRRDVLIRLSERLVASAQQDLGIATI